MNNVNLVKVDGLESVITSLGNMAVHFGLRLVASVGIFVVGMWLANRLTLSIKRVMERRRLDASLQSFLGSLISIILKIFVLVIALTTVGVQMTSIVAVLGAASLAIGMALSGTLQNFAGGIVLLLFRPFRVGDAIETSTGDVGVVKRIMIFTTEVRTFDNQVVFLPNGALSNGVITNLSRGAFRRIDVNVSVAYGSKIENVRKEILTILKNDSRVRSEPAPSVFVSSLGDSAVVVTARFWARYEDVAPLTATINEQIYETLPKKKISFPFPQMDVHIVK